MKISFRLLLLSLVMLGVQPSYAAIFTVTNVNPSGPGSLLDQVAAANSNAGPDEIHFDIAGVGPHSVQLPQTLDITEALLIDGLSQPGASGPNNLVTIDVNGHTGFNLEASNVEISGLKFIDEIGSNKMIQMVWTNEGYSYRDISINNNFFEGGFATFVSFQSGSLQNIEFVDNVIGTKHLDDSKSLKVELGSLNGFPPASIDSLLIARNVIQINSGDYLTGLTLNLNGEGNPPTARHIIIEENVFNCELGGTVNPSISVSAGGETAKSGKISEVLIVRNILNSMHLGGSHYGISLIANSGNGGNGIIEDVEIGYNEFLNTNSGIAVTTSGGNLNAAKINNVKITGNLLNDVGGAGILIRGENDGLAKEMQHYLIDNNVVSGGQLDKIMLFLENAAGGTGGGASEYQDFRIVRNVLSYGHFVGVSVINRNGAFRVLAPSIHGVLISENSITNNLQGGISIGDNRDCDLPVPIIKAVLDEVDSYTVTGVLRDGVPNTDYKLEFFIDSQLYEFGFGEGERFVGSTTISLDSAGRGGFRYELNEDLRSSYVSLNATNLTTMNTGCMSKAEHFVEFEIPTVSEPEEPIFNVFPNPTTNGIVSFTYPPSNLLGISLYAMDGRIADKKHINGQQIDLSENKAGVYVLKITTSIGSFIRKIVFIP